MGRSDRMKRSRREAKWVLEDLEQRWRLLFWLLGILERKMRVNAAEQELDDEEEVLRRRTHENLSCYGLLEVVLEQILLHSLNALQDVSFVLDGAWVLRDRVSQTEQTSAAKRIPAKTNG